VDAETAQLSIADVKAIHPDQHCPIRPELGREAFGQC
jgi:hypothetical protein